MSEDRRRVPVGVHHGYTMTPRPRRKHRLEGTSIRLEAEVLRRADALAKRLAADPLRRAQAEPSRSSVLREAASREDPRSWP